MYLKSNKIINLECACLYTSIEGINKSILIHTNITTSKIFWYFYLDFSIKSADTANILLTFTYTYITYYEAHCHTDELTKPRYWCYAKMLINLAFGRNLSVQFASEVNRANSSRNSQQSVFFWIKIKNQTLNGALYNYVRMICLKRCMLCWMSRTWRCILQSKANKSVY